MAALAAALLSASCAADDQVVVGPDDPAASVVFPAAVTYAYQPDTQLNYRVEMNGTDRIRNESDGIPENLDFELGLPVGELQLETSGVLDLTYRIGPGPDEKTREIHLATDLAEMSVTGAEDLDEDLDETMLELIDLAVLPAVTVVIDEQGKILEFALSEVEPSAESAEQVLFRLFQEQIASAGAIGANFNGPLGPVFPTDRLLDIGSVWMDRTESRIGGRTIVTDLTHEIAGLAELNGVEVIVIETAAATGGYEIDLEDLVESALEAVMADIEDPTGDQAFDEAELAATAEGIATAVAGVSQAWGPTTVESTTWMSYKRIADGLIGGFVQQAVIRTSGTLTTEIDLSGHYDSAPDLVVRTSNELDYEVRFTLVDDDQG